MFIFFGSCIYLLLMPMRASGEFSLSIIGYKYIFKLVLWRRVWSLMAEDGVKSEAMADSPTSVLEDEV